MSINTAFVTGASRGIGAAIAEKLAQEGYHLAINARNGERLREKAGEISERYSVTCLPFAGGCIPGKLCEGNFCRDRKKAGRYQPPCK